MAVPSAPPGPTETIVLGGGCFWCTEAVFSEVRGVRSARPGYAGGTVPDPSYEAVCTGRTGHAEVVEVLFDPREISLHDLLVLFLTTHDPTTVDRQGPDVGSQYRSTILYARPEHRAVAEAVLREVAAAGLWKRPLVTRLEPLTAFYPAEEYHRDYFRRHPEQAYCQAIIAPKVAKFRREHAAQRRPR